MVCEKYGLEVNSAERRNPGLLHSKLGAHIAMVKYGVDYTGYVQGAQNAQIYDAVQDKMVSAKGVIPEAGAFFKITPVVDTRMHNGA